MLLFFSKQFNIYSHLHVKKEKIYLTYVLNNNSNREKQVILLMIPNGDGCKAKSGGWQKWHYLTVKKIVEIVKQNNKIFKITK